MSGVVVDTSAWIEFFAGRPTERLDHALRVGSVILSPIVVAELLSGARRSRDREAIVELMSRLALHPTPLDHWMAVGDLRASLGRRGLSVSTPDAHVAQCAIECDAVLLSLDAVFGRIAKMSSLRMMPD